MFSVRELRESERRKGGGDNTRSAGICVGCWPVLRLMGPAPTLARGSMRQQTGHKLKRNTATGRGSMQPCVPLRLAFSVLRGLQGLGAASMNDEGV
jgi:hypothetical protein